MPYIIMKRDDIPAGTLQVHDLDPNTSQRNYTIDPPGQTKYVNPVENDAVVTFQPGGGGTPISIFREARGLAGWLLTNVSDGTGVAATGNFTIAAGNVVAGATAQINASSVGGPNLTFTFVAGAPATNVEVQVGASNVISTTNLAARISLAANGFAPYLTASPAAGVTTITATTQGTAGNSIALTVTGANLTRSAATLAGGVDTNALTAANVNAMATNILEDLVRFGDLTLPAVTMNLAAVNAVLAGTVATAALTAAQLEEMFDILAGRQYVVPARTQIDSNGTTFAVSPAVGASGGPGFVAGTLRDVFVTDSLTLSMAQGQLAAFTSTDFVYRGTAGNPNGEAVVVINDDGTLFTP
jgi:hypothetical protein